MARTILSVSFTLPPQRPGGLSPIDSGPSIPGGMSALSGGFALCRAGRATKRSGNPSKTEAGHPPFDSGTARLELAPGRITKMTTIL
jgi:hypothetical protein